MHQSNNTTQALLKNIEDVCRERHYTKILVLGFLEMRQFSQMQLKFS